MPINECCSTDAVFCDPETPVTDVAALMRKHHVGAVVVAEQREQGTVPVGIVTDRDIVMETIALQVDVTVFTAGDLMTSPVVTAREDEGLIETLRHMRDRKVRRMPVVTHTGTLYGVVSADDIINLLAMELSLVTGTIVEQQASEEKYRK